MESENTKPQARNVARNSVLLALAQAAVMIAGGINAVVIGARYPISSATDSLFMAYAIYSVWLVIAASTRTALVSRLLSPDERFGPFNVALGSLAWTLPMVLVTQLVLGIPLIELATGTNSSTGIEALLIFTPAALLQLGIAIAAAMFAVLDDFVAPAVAFALGGIVNVASFLVLEPALGLVALPLAALASSAATAAALIFALRKKGWRANRVSLLRWRGARPWLLTVALGSAYALVSQILYLISMSFAGTQLSAGSATIYTYSYMAIGLVVALSASSGSMALAAPVAESWTGDARALAPVEDEVTKLMAVLLTGAAGLLITMGTTVAGALLTEFSAAEVRQLVDSATTLCLLAMGCGVAIVPMVAMYTARRYADIAIASTCFIPVLAALTWVLLQVDASLVAISLAASLTMVAIAWSFLWLAHGRQTPDRVFAQLSQTVVVAVPGAACYLLAKYLIGDATFLAAFCAGILGSIAFAGFTLAFLPSYRNLLLRMFRQVTGVGAGT